MSLPGERASVLGFGRGFTTAVSKFATPNHDAIKWRNFVVAGITKDGTGTPLAGVTVDVYETLSDTFRGRAISDANGLYSVNVNSPDSGITFYARADLAGAPERAGTTVEVMTVTEL